MVMGAKKSKLHNSKTEAPAAGKSGTYLDESNKILHVYYGDDHLEQHMAHLMENHRLYPHNDQLFDVHPEHSTKNRKKAMKDSKKKTVLDHARDEKPPNFVVHDGKSVTVRHLPKKESSKHFLE